MEYLHTMVRVANLEESLDFYCNKFGLVEVRRTDNEKGRYTLVFLAAPGDVERAKDSKAPLLELTHNWDENEYAGGRNFGHLAYRVDDIYETCRRLMTATWLSSSPRTTSRSSCSSAASRSRCRSPGRPCPIPERGELELKLETTDPPH
jgi:catechol 2,3-dioxygenase-like lactoylglutathione lyase family enzyme